MIKQLLIYCTVIALLLSASLPLTFATNSIKQAEDYYSDALKLPSDKSNAAITLMSKAISLNPTNPEYYHQRGFYYAVSKNLKSALADFERAIILDPEKYFQKTFGGYIVNNTYHDDFLGFNMSTKAFTLYKGPVVTDIKKYFMTYKGSDLTKVKNASALMKAATGGSYVTMTAKDKDGSSLAIFSITTAPSNKQKSGVELHDKIKSLPYNFKVSNMVKSKLGSKNATYFDFEIKGPPKTLMARQYIMNFNDFVYTILVTAEDSSHFDMMIKDLINTISM